MKRNDINDLKTKSKDELTRMLIDSRDLLLKATHEATLVKSKNTNMVKNTKKKIARILTFLSMKETVEKEVAHNG
jgi:ribosomal protein L29